MMSSHTRPCAIVTGTSCGIGYELAKCCAEQGKRLCHTRRFLGETKKLSVRHSRCCLVKGDREHGDAVYVG